MTVNYDRIIELLRKIYPKLSLDNVKADIEKTVEEALGIDIKYSDMFHLESKNDVSGYVHVVNGKPEIVVNGNDTEYRRRFTIAHELGHIFLHWAWLPDRKIDENLVEVSYRNNIYDTNEKQIKEYEADAFAAEFLAPISKVRESLDQYRRSDIYNKEEQIQRLIHDYKISNGTAFYQWKEANNYNKG